MLSVALTRRRSIGIRTPSRCGRVDRLRVAGVDVAHDAHARVGESARARCARRPPACRRRRPPGRRGSTCPCRRRRRGGSTPSTRRAAVLTSALSSGQSATASEPSRIASVSRCGEATEPGVEVVAADHDRRPQLARGDHLVEAQPGEVALAVAEPADPRRQALEVHALAARARIQRRDVLLVAEQVEDRRVGRGDVRRVARQRRPSGTGPCPRRTAAGCRRGRSRGRRTRPRRRARRPRRAARCRSRTPRRRGACSSRIAPTWASTRLARRARRYSSGSRARSTSACSSVSPAGT